MPRIALVTCDRFPDLDDDDRLALPALRALGLDGVPAVWNDPGVDWAGFDVVVLRETWDYVEHRDEFVAWLGRVDQVSLLRNPVDVVAWNIDKRYLRDLRGAGIPVVPTTFLEPGDADWQSPSGAAEFVVKPAMSAGSRDTVRYSASASLEAARAHVARLLDDGRTVMIQPYLSAIDTVGETALLFIGGEFSHAIRKGPLLSLGTEGERVEGLFVQEQIDPRTPSDAELAVARAVLDAVPGGHQRLLYARVDLIPDADGRPRLLELELTEPSLFLLHDDEAQVRLAVAIAGLVSGPKT